MEKQIEIEKTTGQRRTRRGIIIDVISWVFFFAWLGVVLLYKPLPDGAGAVGVSVIVIGCAVVRILFRVSVSYFWFLIGAVFLAAGVVEILKFDLPALPIALIICGVLLLIHRRSKKLKNSF